MDSLKNKVPHNLLMHHLPESMRWTLYGLVLLCVGNHLSSFCLFHSLLFAITLHSGYYCNSNSEVFSEINWEDFSSPLWCVLLTHKKYPFICRKGLSIKWFWHGDTKIYLHFFMYMNLWNRSNSVLLIVTVKNMGMSGVCHTLQWT